MPTRQHFESYPDPSPRRLLDLVPDAVVAWTSTQGVLNEREFLVFDLSADFLIRFLDKGDYRKGENIAVAGKSDD